MNKGMSLGFLLVLLVVALGFYVALTSFQSTREAMLALPTSTPREEMATPLPSATPTVTVTLPAPVPSPTLPLTATLEPSASPPPVATPKPGKATPTPTPLPPTPTPVAAASFEFRLAGPPGPDAAWPSCCYLAGTVRDAAGNGLEGIRVQVFNQWIAPVIAVTKGGTEAGQYNVPIGRDVIVWSVLVVNEAGEPISPRTDISFDPAVANAFRVDWRRSR